jgi:glucosamine-6-phosphate deaminase
VNTIICKEKRELRQRAATAGAEIIRTAIRERGAANIIVATGASQFEMLAALAGAPDIAWDKVTAFHLDEYVRTEFVGDMK